MITVQGGAQRRRVSDAPPGAPFTVIFRGERMPGAWRTARPARAGAVIADRRDGIHRGTTTDAAVQVDPAKAASDMDTGPLACYPSGRDDRRSCVQVLGWTAPKIRDPGAAEQ